MADINPNEDDSEDTTESDNVVDLGFDDYETDSPNTDAGLTMLERLEKYCDNENMYTRQMVTRSLLETIRTIENEEETQTLLKAIGTLADDPDCTCGTKGSLNVMACKYNDVLLTTNYVRVRGDRLYQEAMVRSELMEHIPHIAIYCLENMQIFGDPIPTHLLPIVVNYITDSNNQVRKTSQAALLVLLEQDMIKRDDVEAQVCPVIVQLAQPDSTDDFRTEAAALMSKLAPLVGKEATDRIFLERFTNMCLDPLFHVRKVCATNFGDFCQVVGREQTETKLLHKFYYLCEDGVWGVRKACAECFMQVSCVCSGEMRRTELAQLFVNLICDQSRWVRMAAFQALGGFISTFADPSNTGLYFSDEGYLMVGKPEDFVSQRSMLCSKSDIPRDSSACDSNTSCKNDQHKIQVPAISQRTENVSEDAVNSGSSTDASNIEPGTSALTLSEGDSMELVCDDRDIASISTEVQQINLDISVEERRAKDYPTSTYDSSMRNKGDSYSHSSQDDQTVTAQLTEIVSPAIGASSKIIVPSNTRQLSSDSDSDSLQTIGSDANPENICIHMDNTTAFDNFQYWRMPLPEVDVDAVECKTIDENDEAKVNDFGTSKSSVAEFDIAMDGVSLVSSCITTTEPMIEAMEVDQPLESNLDAERMETGDCNANVSDDKSEDNSAAQIHTASVRTVCETVEEVANFGSTHVLGQHVQHVNDGASEGVMALTKDDVQDVKSTSLILTPVDDGLNVTDVTEEPSSMEDLALSDQDVIPQALLDHYISMIDPSRAQTVDAEIARHCAYSLPAVAYTLGRKYWPCLKDLYDKLAGDMQWKVRRTLAFSIHELAIILGEDITSRDLVPVFNGFLKDLDEVRVGVLKHLGDFLRLLNSNMRQEYLTKIYEFLNTDNTRNWRFREELALQLHSLLELYSAEDISEHLVPVGFMLTEDPVAAVRHCAFRVISAMVGRLNAVGDNKQLSTLMNDIKERFADSSRWGNRQMYVLIAQNVLEENALSQDQFALEILPVLMKLSKDPIPNVRIALSRTLSQFVVNSDYYRSTQNPLHSTLLEAIETLKCDNDRDVRQFLTSVSDNSQFLTSMTDNIDLDDTIPI